MIDFYYHPSPNPAKVALFLEESGLPYTLVPVDTRVWLGVLALAWEHRDPADRVIVATAQLDGLPLVSSDAAIAQFYAKTVWE